MDDYVYTRIDIALCHYPMYKFLETFLDGSSAFLLFSLMGLSEDRALKKIVLFFFVRDLLTKP